MGFTPEQIKAIEYRDRSAVVSASAGSGKTSVLVEHIAALISDEENQVPADRLAVVTFTEKAAAELRQRLDSRVSRLLKEQPSDFLQEQLVRLSSARISTISSFCLSLIRDNIRLLPLDEGFAVGDETQTQLLSDKALKKMFRRMYGEFLAEEKAEIAWRLGGEREIAGSVTRLYDFLSNIPSGDDWVKEQLEVLVDPALYEERYLRKAREAAAAAFEDIEPLRARTAELLAAAAELGKADKLTAYFGQYFGQVEEIVSALQNADNNALLRALENGAGRYPSIKNTAGVSCFEELKGVKDVLKAHIEECAKYAQTLPCAENDAHDCKRALELLWRLEQIYSEEYSGLKSARGIVDFSDLERYALQAARLGGGKGMFDYIIVDEFQDSNDIQFELFRLLSKNEQNLYFVGDVKQCIYLFRNANPEIFASLLHHEKYEKILLNKNFRSGDNVINTANLMFGGKMPKSFSGGGWEDMTAGRGIPACAKNSSELVIINSVGEDKGREALYTASRIKQMVEEGFTVHDGDKERPCGYGDFAVLLRTGSKLNNYREAFEDAGIPYVSVGEKAFTDLMEVELAMSILGAVLRPSDDISVTATLMSPVYGFTAEDMARVRLADGKRPLYRNLSDMLKEGGTELPEGAGRFLSDMKLFRKLAANTVSEELMREIYSVTMLPELMSVGRKGRERRENMRLLLHYARGIPRPADFAAQMRTVKRGKLEMPQAQVLEQEESSVKIMTIHKSKGLQFPVVFIGDCNKKPEERDFALPFIFDRSGGAGIMVCDYSKPVRCVTAGHLLMQDRLEDKVSGEEMRLLYVAMTRAEEKLIITAECVVKPDKDGYLDESKNPVAYKGNYLDFIRNRLEQVPDALSLTRITTEKPVHLQKIDTKRSEKKLPDFSEIGRRINSKYPFESAVNTPAKFTATALGVAAGEAGDEATLGGALYMGLPLFMKKNRPLTPKERGDVYHKVMENLDLTAASAEEELNRMQGDSTITEDERKAVDAAELQSFLDSDIARRARNSSHVEREFRIFTTVNKTGLPDPDDDDLSFVQGVADMFFEEDGKIVLVDYKTNRSTTPEKLIDEYKGQLEIYKKALAEMTGLEVGECWLFSFSLKRSIAVDDRGGFLRR